MSCGVYVLRPDEEEMQRPLHQDEIYYVFSGAGRMRVVAANRPPEDRGIAVGDVIFVAAHDEHRFHNFPSRLPPHGGREHDETSSCVMLDHQPGQVMDTSTH